MGNETHCLGARGLLDTHSKGLQDTCSRHLQHFGAFCTPVWVTAQQLQTPAKPRSRESRERATTQSVRECSLFCPSFKNQTTLLPPEPIHPPGTAWSITAATSPPGKRGDVRGWMGLSVHSAREKQLSGSTGHLCPQPRREAAQLP